MVGTLESDVREKFRRSGYTLTSQRRAVLEALKDYNGHPSAEEVYLLVKKRNPKVALGTVYQALSVLEEIGLIEAKRWSESPVRYDLNTEPHYDIRCTKCDEVAEISDITFGDFVTRIQENTPYEVTNAALVIEGVCPLCRAEESPQARWLAQPQYLASLSFARPAAPASSPPPGRSWRVAGLRPPRRPGRTYCNSRCHAGRGRARL